MEHVNQARPPYYAEVDRQGHVRVWQNAPRRPLLCTMDGLTKSEEVKWANRAARGLCYDTAGVKRAHRAAKVGFAGGLLVATFACLLVSAVLLVTGQYVRADQCVDVGPYTEVVPPQ